VRFGWLRRPIATWVRRQETNERLGDQRLGKTTPQPAASGDAEIEPDPDDPALMSMQMLVSRSAFGGTLMGLANLVPGISGGTMLLASGIYPQFIEAIAELTRLRFRHRSLLVLCCVVAMAGVAILLFAGTLKDLVVDQRWVMYSIFIGLTLGGLPVVWKLARPASAGLLASAVIAFIGMVAMAVLQAAGAAGSSSIHPLLFFLGGLAGASAMILPGISGGYLLLLLGQYIPILGAIDEFKSALQAGDLSMAMEPALTVLLPVGLGVVAGVVAMGNLLQWLLHHHRKPTLGFLIGLLLGSIAGLWPFQQAVPPRVGDTIKGQVVTEATLAGIETDDWPTEYFQPQLGHVASSLGLIALGFGLTTVISRIGGDE
jgi:putative membrane protein